MIKDMGSIPRSGRSPGGAHGNSNMFAWEVPWTEEPGGLQSMGSQRVGRDSDHSHQKHQKITIN